MQLVGRDRGTTHAGLTRSVRAGRTERCVRQELQPCLGNGFAADRADAVGAGLDPRQCGVDAPNLGQFRQAKRFEHLVALTLRGAIFPVLGWRFVKRVFDHVVDYFDWVTYDMATRWPSSRTVLTGDYWFMEMVHYGALLNGMFNRSEPSHAIAFLDGHAKSVKVTESDINPNGGDGRSRLPYNGKDFLFWYSDEEQDFENTLWPEGL